MHGKPWEKILGQVCLSLSFSNKNTKRSKNKEQPIDSRLEKGNNLLIVKDLRIKQSKLKMMKKTKK